MTVRTNHLAIQEVVVIDSSTGLPFAAFESVPTSFGQKTAENSISVVLASDATTTLTGAGVVETMTITRPDNATAYTAGDVVGDVGGSAIITHSAIGVAGDNFVIDFVDLLIDKTSIPTSMDTFKLAVYDASPTAIVDNDAFALSSVDGLGKFLKKIPIIKPSVVGSILVSENPNLNYHVKLAGTTFYFVLITDGAYTPAASDVLKVRIGYRRI